jgi:hypothetical protein
LLRSVSLTKCASTTDPGMRALSACRELETTDVIYGSLLTDAGLDSVAMGYTEFKKTHLSIALYWRTAHSRCSLADHGVEKITMKLPSREISISAMYQQLPIYVSTD